MTEFLYKLRKDLSYIPDDPLIKVVHSYEEFNNTPTSPVANLIIFPRQLKYDFNALALALLHICGDKKLTHKNFNLRAMKNQVVPLLTSEAALSQGEAVIRLMEENAKRYKNIHLDLERIRMQSRHSSLFGACHGDGAPYVGGFSEWGRTLCGLYGSLTQRWLNKDVLWEFGSSYRPLPGAKPFTLKHGDLARHASRKYLHIPPHFHERPYEITEKTLDFIEWGEDLRLMIRAD